MHKRARRVTVMLLIVILSNITGVSAKEMSTPMILTQEASTFSVTVPTSLPVTVDAVGVVTVANNAEIINNSYGPVELTSVEVLNENGWVVVEYGTDFRKKKVGLKEYTLQLNGENVGADGGVSNLSWGIIYDTLPIKYKADIAAQKQGISSIEIAKVVFTVKWAKEVNPDVPSEPEIPGGVYQAQDTDFTGTTDGDFKYIGAATEVEVPHIIKGVLVTSHKEMFSRTSVTKVVSTNNRVTDMTKMFSFNTGTTLDLDGLDTSGVETMEGMFMDSQSITLKLSNFNTSKVTNMSDMFYGAQAIALDLSSFDTSNVVTMYSMFVGTKAETIEIRSFKTNKVIEMDAMFNNSRVQELDLSSFETNENTRMSGMFRGAYLQRGYARNQVEADRYNNQVVTGAKWEKLFIVKDVGVDTTAPGEVTNLKAIYNPSNVHGLESMRITFTSPDDTDFCNVRVYVDNKFHFEIDANPGEYVDIDHSDAGDLNIPHTIRITTVDITWNESQGAEVVYSPPGE